MAQIAVNNYLNIIPYVMESPKRYLWSSYDEEADVLYINLKKPSYATDSELTEEDIIVRYENDEIIGLTIMNVKNRF